MYRQGDLLFIKTDKVPTGRLKSDLVVLGSSVTGHNHAITQGKIYIVEDTARWDRDRANFYVEIHSGGADLFHPEHATIPLSEGIYEVIRQKEVNGYVRD
jgi:hypothetical protein